MASLWCWIQLHLSGSPWCLKACYERVNSLHHELHVKISSSPFLQQGLEKLYEMILKRKKMLRHSKKKR
ncbi:hypothetical protein KIL84_008442 [Mauremys mutica]|uniref:Uncharacterized protein n=1 Tax=Mauremys mutica TaxID=74926 RepID=A0A9D3X717_9SAUR|nr:hypothetical protein KIL84_008442 [Mauremys mutica]